MIYDEDMRTDNMVREREQLRFRLHEKINRFMEHWFWNDIDDRIAGSQRERIDWIRGRVLFDVREGPETMKQENISWNLYRLQLETEVVLRAESNRQWQVRSFPVYPVDNLCFTAQEIGSAHETH